jgi:hypothetical protein
MRRRLPSEPERLVKELGAWIAWRHSSSREPLVLTSAPTSLPLDLQQWMPGAVWRLAWQTSGVAVLYGMAAASEPTRYFVGRHDGAGPIRDGTFERLPDGSWALVQGDTLDLPPLAHRRFRQVA